MKYWLLKSEPTDYSIDDLKREKTTPWDGVRNYQARNMLRDDMGVRDKALFYHSNAGPETGVVGEMVVVSEPKIDATQFDPKDAHYDPKAEKDNPRWYCPDFSFVSKFDRVVTLEEIKKEAVFRDSRLTMRGNRLSVVPLTKTQYQRAVKLSNK